MSEKTIESTMLENRVFPPSPEFSAKAHVKSMEDYKILHQRSLEDEEGFWAEMAEQLVWRKKWDKVKTGGYKDLDFKWFPGGKLNVAENLLDRYLGTPTANRAAIIWQGEPEEETRTLTYQQLHREVCRFANVLRKRGVAKGDRVMIYLPMIPELAIAMLACARVGAVHTVVFGGFSAQSIADRINDCEPKVMVTADAGLRAGRVIALKKNVDDALAQTDSVESCIVYKRVDGKVDMAPGRDFWWDEEVATVPAHSPCEEMDAEDPLFILYTSGSTGKPKGVLHTTAGYLLYTMTTFKWIFDYHPEDVYWCTADIGWITGHSYIVYGPLGNGATSLMFEGVPHYPNPDRFWRVVDKFRVNIFYTAPTAIRSLMSAGEKWVNCCDLSSLRLLGSVGEPINPEAWMWYHKHVGKERCPIVDTWWQTETGGILITPLPGAIPTKPGSATVPFPGVQPVILRQDGSEADVDEGGYLCIKTPWPGQMRTVWGHHERFRDTYFSQYKDLYFTGDGARRDKDGYYWLMGRVDDVLNVAGHRIGTAEVESALVAHEAVAEAAVVGYPHDIKGQGIYAYVTLVTGVTGDDALKKALLAHVAKQIGPTAKPDKIQFAPALCKTRSGKIMRRILRKIAEGNVEEMGDTSTLADPSVVKALVENRV
ncbi:MAG: acetate--CoA ligase [Nitrospinota bacterium]|nr:acetate--CoA ligase [Nitrospinota bacterium]MDH5755505.1 acetate--CoA ligase [Nitrospinota bacterium]